MKGFGEVIFSYTRTMVIADGVLVDISEHAKEAGFTVPVAVTEKLYNDYLVPGEVLVKDGQDSSGRIWDTLILLHLVCKGCNSNVVMFSVSMLMDNGQKAVKMKSVIGPGDKSEPVITIMLPDED